MPLSVVAVFRLVIYTYIGVMGVMVGIWPVVHERSGPCGTWG